MGLAYTAVLLHVLRCPSIPFACVWQVNPAAPEQKGQVIEDGDFPSRSHFRSFEDAHTPIFLGEAHLVANAVDYVAPLLVIVALTPVDASQACEIRVLRLKIAPPPPNPCPWYGVVRRAQERYLTY